MYQRNPEIEAAMQEFMTIEKTRKKLHYARMNKHAHKGQILFTGSSLMEQFPICEFYKNDEPDSDKILYNRGISGFTTDEFLEAIDSVCLDLEPSKIFINIGTNDLNERDDGEDWLAHLTKNYDIILSKIREALPECTIYCMDYYPVNEQLISRINTAAGVKLKTRTNQRVQTAIEAVTAIAKSHGALCINCNDGLTDDDGQLKRIYTVEGIHMYANGYKVVYDNLKKYI